VDPSVPARGARPDSTATPEGLKDDRPIAVDGPDGDEGRLHKSRPLGVTCNHFEIPHAT
jgi:hypothetical protein